VATLLPGEFDADQRYRLEMLAAAAGAGNGDALAELLELVQPLVVRYCRARLANDAPACSADDVAQDVCMALIASLPTYRNDNSSFLSFLFQIATRKITDAYRNIATARRYLEVVDEVPDQIEVAPEPEQAALQRELAGRVGGLLAHLSARHRTIVTLRVAMGLSAVETARLLDTTPGAIRVTQHRAMSTLRAIISGGLPGDDAFPNHAIPDGVGC
jgi:RNA polymerase sigma-70 factor, ECF subfamily